MALVSKVIPSFHNGISQQPSVLRLDTQYEDSVNGYATLVDGMGKRPPSEHLAVLSSNASSNSFVHTINRDSSEQYIVCITGVPEEPIEIYKLPEGTKCTVAIGYFDSADLFHADLTKSAYLTSTGTKTALESFKATTIADYTVITNNTKVAAMSATTDDTFKYEGLAVISKGVAGTSYYITVNGITASYTSGDTTAYDTYRTSTIASNLATQLTSGLGASYIVALTGSTIYVTKVDGTDFTMSVTDSWGDQATKMIKGNCQNFTDLPGKAFDGVYVEITGNPQEENDNYWVQYSSDTGTKTGVWQEVVKPGLANTIDGTTMPHKLIRSGVNTFQFGSFYWSKRKVGDTLTAPEPSFIGNTVNDVFFYRNRLGLLSSENIILSQASEYFNFFPTSVTLVLDDDPIDLAVSTNEVSTLYNAAPFNTFLLAFGDQQQFQIGSGDALLTSKTMKADATTHFSNERDCKPAPAGSNVYFASPRGNFSAIREYFVQPGSLTNDAADVTAHVTQLVPKDVIKIAASSSLDTVLVLSEQQRDTLYVYKYFWNGDEKAQSAWFKWTFDGTIINMDMLDTSLYLLIQRDSSVCLERIKIEKEVTGTLPYRVYLDRQVAVVGTYNSNTGYTTWTLPYSDDSLIDNFRVIRSDDGNMIHLIEKVSNTSLKAPGDYSGIQCYIGTTYIHSHVFSEWHIKSGNTNVGVQQGRLLIRTLTLTFSDTGYFKLQVTPEGRPMKYKTFNAVVLGQYYVGTPALYSETKRFDIVSRSDKTKIELVNDSHLPAWFHSGSFEGTFIARSQQI